ncbi:MAG TPA: EAL domain-containing protein [Burkholderiales bacterium]|nr:EAL domain-containing protein [Burkholderiales bacterium]
MAVAQRSPDAAPVRIDPHDTIIASLVEGQPNWTHPRARLARAFLADDFLLFGQPIVSLGEAGRRVEFVEILVRLREEEALCLPPGSFLPTLESHGMMPLFDRWVVRRAARWLAERGLESRPGLFLNLAHDTLVDPRFPTSVARTLEYTGIPPARVCFEVPELMAAQDPAVVLAAVRAFRALGCQVALASCGREPGYFAPQVLAECSFVKIDGGLVVDAEHDFASAAWLGALLAACRAAGARVIAEYVESDAALERAGELGVTLAQGFAIARPVPIAELPAVIP